MYKVIIVEDERAIRRGLCILIDWESIGFTVEATAEDGLEALNMLEKKNFDVVLTDIRMPKLDGLGLAREIRERIHEAVTNRQRILRRRKPLNG